MRQVDIGEEITLEFYNMKKSLLVSMSMAIILLVSSCISGNPGKGKPSGNASSGQAQETEATKSNADAQAGDAEQSAQQEVNMTPVGKHPKIQVFLETSGSMNGYVNGGTSVFQQVVKEYLSGINNANYASEVSYNYITSKVTPQANDLNSYITKLTPKNFAANGNVSTTDIGGIFKQVLSMTDPNTVSILITDGIISPGKGVDTRAYLTGQTTDVRDAIVNYINQYGDLACLVYQLDSRFKGNYFDFENTKHPIDQQRPFYIWVFGHTLSVAMLKLQYVPDRDFKVTPIRNQWMIFNTDLSIFQDQFQYGVILPNTTSIGKYTRVDKTTLRGIQKPDPTDNYRFSFGANISVATYLMGEDYVCDTRNYVHLVNRLSKQEFFGKIETDYNGNSPYSNIFRVESEQPFSKGTFSLAFVPQVPDWAHQCTDYDDRSFDGNNDDKTYGLEAIFNGIFNGYNNANHDNIIAQFDFEIR